MKKILVVDNKDSFVYNLVEFLRINGRCEFDVVRSGNVDFNNLNHYNAILLSPGAGTPSDYPDMMEVIDKCKFTHSILGVCLGHQAIAEYFGAQLMRMSQPKHGHCSNLLITLRNQLNCKITSGAKIGRYHSWVVNPSSIPQDIVVSGIDEDGNIMMIHHLSLPIYGVQFHPESIITEFGQELIDSWVSAI